MSVPKALLIVVVALVFATAFMVLALAAGPS